MQYTELDMRDRFNAQERYVAAFLEGYDVFEHIGILLQVHANQDSAGRSADGPHVG